MLSYRGLYRAAGFYPSPHKGGVSQAGVIAPDYIVALDYGCDAYQIVHIVTLFVDAYHSTMGAD